MTTPPLPEQIELHRDRMWRRDEDVRIESAVDAERFIEGVGFANTLTDARRAGPSLYIAVCGRRDVSLPRHVQKDEETRLTWYLKDEVMRRGRRLPRDLHSIRKAILPKWCSASALCALLASSSRNVLSTWTSNGPESIRALSLSMRAGLFSPSYASIATPSGAVGSGITPCGYAIRPPWRIANRASSVSSPPAVTSAASSPLGANSLAASRTLGPRPSTALSAPSFLASCTPSLPEAMANTSAPRRLASCKAKCPMPPLAPKTINDSPDFKPSTFSKPVSAVNASVGNTAACSIVKCPGINDTLSALTAA